MELAKVIEQVDALCPNPYTFQEKLGRCDEVSASLRKEIKKVYDTIETTVTSLDMIELPDDISFDDIEVAYINGTPMSKLDFRSFVLNNNHLTPSSPIKLKLVFLTKPSPTRVTSIDGNFDVSDNFIKIDEPPFHIGDLIQWAYIKDGVADWSNSGQSYVLDYVYDGIVVEDNSFEPQSQAQLSIRRVVDDVTELEDLPYATMYIEYLLAKLALYQHDYTSYSAHLTQYNSLYDRAKKDYKNRAPLNELAVFRNFW